MSDDLLKFITERLAEDEREIRNDPPVGMGYAILPHRMLREVGHHRAILAEHTGSGCVKEVCCGEIAATYDAEDGDPCPTIRHLGAIWSDDPRYCAEWKPLSEAVNTA